MLQRVLICGGTGFVGSNLAASLKHTHPHMTVLALDNLRRPGGDLRLSRLRSAGVEFHYGDVRRSEDLNEIGEFDLLIDCAAEPSVYAGMRGSPEYLLQTNLGGTIECLEAARKRCAAFMLLSTSRVFPIKSLNSLPHEEAPTRFTWLPQEGVTGYSQHGIAESFPLAGARSMYGATKLASEVLVTEYAAAYGMRTIVNRCGLIAGPGQIGHADQGIVAMWVARHLYRMPLCYTGFGGTGKQVRDILHVADLQNLIERQLSNVNDWDGQIYNVGGGNEFCVSMLELTEICRSVTGHRVPVGGDPKTNDVDLRIFISDCRKAQEAFGWRPKHDATQVVSDCHAWIADHAVELSQYHSQNEQNETAHEHG